MLPFTGNPLDRRSDKRSDAAWMAEHLAGAKILPVSIEGLQFTRLGRMGGKLRLRSVPNVIEELEYLIKTFDVQEIFIDTDTFTRPRIWVKDFCNEIIKRNIKLESTEKASVADSTKVVEICTKYAQKGMFNIFLAVFFATLSFAFMEPFLFVGYLFSIAIFGLYEAIFMANAGGAWDNAKKVVEVDLNMKGTPLHDATVIGDTVGDPFKDTSSVAMNPIIKFTTLFGLLAVELAVTLSATNPMLTHVLTVAFFLVSMFFVHRSFYGMRIETKEGK